MVVEMVVGVMMGSVVSAASPVYCGEEMMAAADMLAASVGLGGGLFRGDGAFYNLHRPAPGRCTCTW